MCQCDVECTVMQGTTALHRFHNSMTTLLVLCHRAERAECKFEMLHRVQIDGVPEVAVTTPATAAICTATLPNSMERRGRVIVLTRPPTEQPVHDKAAFWKDLSCSCQHKGFAKGHDRMLT